MILVFGIKIVAESKKIAQYMTPKDSGNLAINSLTVKQTNNGFKLVYRYIYADYMNYLNDGTIYTDVHEGWAKKVARQVSAYINMSQNGKRNTMSAVKGRLNQYPDNTRRQRTMMASLQRNVRSR